MIYITGDCHGDWTKLSNKKFSAQKEMNRNDYLIVCGDFGIWHDDKTERWWLKWLSNKNFTLLFVDGNHENFDRLYSSEFDVINFCGGKAHKIRENIYHLMRGYVFDLSGKTFFAFGGATSHDIDDGVLYPNDFKTKKELMNEFYNRTQSGEMLRIDHLSWWKEEMPSKTEMDFGLKTLADYGNKIDYIVSHTCPQKIASYLGFENSDELTQYFNTVSETVQFKKWFFGHHHKNQVVNDKFVMLYERIVRVL